MSVDLVFETPSLTLGDLFFWVTAEILNCFFNPLQEHFRLDVVFGKIVSTEDFLFHHHFSHNQSMKNFSRRSLHRIFPIIDTL